MKKLIIFYGIIFSQLIYAQTGINTQNPSATLDVNGDLRIRETLPVVTLESYKDSILVVNGRGKVLRATSQQIMNSYLKTCVKGRFSAGSGTLLSLSLLSNRALLPFDTEDFDFNDEFNTVSHIYKAKQDGIYSINVQIRFDSGIAVSTHLGIAILKNNAIVNRVAFANVGALGINVTPPVRSLQTLVALSKDDEIKFIVTSNLLGVSVLGDSEESFFTIHQIR